MPDPLERRAHALFMRALDVPEPERDSFAALQCDSDPALLTRVRALLGAVDRSTGFLETPALQGPHGVAPGTVRVRGYQVQRVLGSGGMGTVYEAVQDRPRRTVALKVMNRALADTSAQRRFEYETEVLARLRHPGIAQIFEAGTCDTGDGQRLPFFAMELVQGACPITTYAGEHALTLRDRLVLFALACDAVEHGHLLGVIHRDLKPANILIDSEGRPKVIDFGVARSTRVGPDDLTAAPDAGRLVGTLHAMSPEQCGAAADTDARTDVYSLGVVLYQLIAGRRPYDLSDASIPAAIRTITEQTPPSPSVFCAASKGDLDAIVAKAMHKDREGRYSGAGGLAADIRRYLNGEPIEARRTSAFGQLTRFARRNRAFSAAVLAATVILVSGITVSSILAFIATKARQASEERERDLEAVVNFQEAQLGNFDARAMGEHLRQALIQAVASRGNADPAQAQRDVEDFTRLCSRINFTTMALGSIDEAVLEKSRVALAEQFADQPVLRARLLHRLAGTLAAVGLPGKAEPLLVDALALRRTHLGENDQDTLITLHGLGAVRSQLGRFAEAESSLREAHTRLASTLGPEHRSTLSAANSLGGVLRRQGKHEEARAIWSSTLEAQRRTLGPDHTDTLRTLNNMGVLHAVLGEMDAAQACWQEVLERRRRTLGPEHPDTLGALSNLGTLLTDRGDYAGARPLLDEALASSRRHLGDRHADTLLCLAQLAGLILESGDAAGAEPMVRECLEGRLATLGPEHQATLLAKQLLAETLSARGQHDAALALLTETLGIQERTLGEAHPDTKASRAALSRVRGRMDKGG